jgi:hypothetical protein
VIEGQRRGMITNEQRDRGQHRPRIVPKPANWDSLQIIRSQPLAQSDGQTIETFTWNAIDQSFRGCWRSEFRSRYETMSLLSTNREFRIQKTNSGFLCGVWNSGGEWGWEVDFIPRSIPPANPDSSLHLPAGQLTSIGRQYEALRCCHSGGWRNRHSKKKVKTGISGWRVGMQCDFFRLLKQHNIFIRNLSKDSAKTATQPLSAVLVWPSDWQFRVFDYEAAVIGTLCAMLKSKIS